MAIEPLPPAELAAVGRQAARSLLEEIVAGMCPCARRLTLRYVEAGAELADLQHAVDEGRHRCAAPAAMVEEAEDR